MNDHDGIIPQIARNGVPGSPPRPTTHTHTRANRSRRAPFRGWLPPANAQPGRRRPWTEGQMKTQMNGETGRGKAGPLAGLAARLEPRTPSIPTASARRAEAILPSELPTREQTPRQRKRPCLPDCCCRACWARVRRRDHRVRVRGGGGGGREERRRGGQFGKGLAPSVPKTPGMRLVQECSTPRTPRSPVMYKDEPPALDGRREKAPR